MGADAFVALREGMRKSKVAAIARTVLFRRMRTVLIKTAREGPDRHDAQLRLRGSLLEKSIPKLKIEGEMLDLAKHIISTKKGDFDPATFDDRYEAALAELVKAKMEGDRCQAEEGRDLQAERPPRRASRERRADEGSRRQTETHRRQRQCWHRPAACRASGGWKGRLLEGRPAAQGKLRRLAMAPR
jgi:non-homologous end joining protein Ku